MCHHQFMAGLEVTPYHPPTGGVITSLDSDNYWDLDLRAPDEHLTSIHEAGNVLCRTVAEMDVLSVDTKTQLRQADR